MTLQACADLVQRADPDRFLCAMAAPPDARAKLFPLFAYNVEISRAPWVTAEPMIAEMRLQWWRDAVEEIGADGPVRAHEVTQPLADLVRSGDLPVALLDQMAVARRWDIYTDSFENDAHFDEYLDHTGGHLMWLSALSLGAKPLLEPTVRQFAKGAAIANMLAAAQELDQRGRKPLMDGTTAGITTLAQAGLAALSKVGPVPKSIVPALWPGWQARRLLTLAIKKPQRALNGTLHLSEFTKRVSLLKRQMFGTV